jgi:serine/threonine protein kinase
MENVIVDADLSIQLIDFGLSTVTTDGCADDLCGTPGYLAPEILR